MSQNSKPQHRNFGGIMTTFVEQDAQCFTCRITGKQSIERLAPLIDAIVPQAVFVEAKDLRAGYKTLDLVWETTCEKDIKEHHQKAAVYNKLSNSQIIESKASFAFLQQLIDYPMLETWVATNAAIVSVWATKRWVNGTSTKHAEASSHNRDWWVVKASKGNGGRDIWVMNPANFAEVLPQLPDSDEYVIQRYALNPLLFRGKKFHFRCYTTMSAIGTAHLYQKAFILSAGLDFDYADADVRKHVTNLSVNKRFAGHPGQVPCHLPVEYPQVYAQIGKMWSAVVTAALPYMEHQVSGNHFEFFGIDVIADREGGVWMVEANRLPGLESSKNNKAEEDAMYDEMMTSLLHIVLRPILPAERRVAENGLWDTVRVGSNDEVSPPQEVWKNVLKWRAYIRSCREMVLAEYA